MLHVTTNSRPALTIGQSVELRSHTSFSQDGKIVAVCDVEIAIRLMNGHILRMKPVNVPGLGPMYQSFDTGAFYAVS